MLHGKVRLLALANIDWRLSCASLRANAEGDWERVHSELRTISQELEASTATLGFLESLYQASRCGLGKQMWVGHALSWTL